SAASRSSAAGPRSYGSSVSEKRAVEVLNGGRSPPLSYLAIACEPRRGSAPAQRVPSGPTRTAHTAPARHSHSGHSTTAWPRPPSPWRVDGALQLHAVDRHVEEDLEHRLLLDVTARRAERHEEPPPRERHRRRRREPRPLARRHDARVLAIEPALRAARRDDAAHAR